MAGRRDEANHELAWGEWVAALDEDEPVELSVSVAHVLLHLRHTLASETSGR